GPHTRLRTGRRADVRGAPTGARVAARLPGRFALPGDRLQLPSCRAARHPRRIPSTSCPRTSRPPVGQRSAWTLCVARVAVERGTSAGEMHGGVAWSHHGTHPECPQPGRGIVPPDGLVPADIDPT